MRSTWSAALQDAAPVSALLVRALERCAARDDTRLSRVVIDLLGPVPAEGYLWVRSQVERPGKQIELISAEMLALGPDGQPRPTARASGWRLQQLDTAELIHAAKPLPRPVSEARSRNLEKDWDRNYVHSLDWPGRPNPERWSGRILDQADGEPGQRRGDDAVGAAVRGGRLRQGVGSELDIRKWTFLNNDLAVHVHRIPDGDWIGIRAETNYGPDGIATTVGHCSTRPELWGSIQQSVLVRRRSRS